MELLTVEIRKQIYSIRGQQVMFDSDLALLFETKTKVINQAVRRNLDRFPEDFSFQLEEADYESLYQTDISKKPKRGHNRKYFPQVFTEHGVGMLSSVLNSKRALEVNIAVVRTFTQLRKNPIEQASELHNKLDQLNEKIIQLQKQNEHQTSIIRKAVLNSLVSKPTLLGDPLKNEPPRFVSASTLPRVEAVQRVTAKYFNVTSADLKSSSRIQEAVIPRQMAMYLARKHTGMSFKELGRAFGGKDHSTILHAFQKVTLLSRHCSKTQEFIRSIEALLNT